MRYDIWNVSRPAGPGVRQRLEAAGLPALCAVVLSARGLDTPEKAARFLDSGPDRFYDPFLLKDMDRAAERVRRAIEVGEIIAVYGDYDVDGITATCLLTEALTQLGGDVVS